MKTGARGVDGDEGGDDGDDHDGHDHDDDPNDDDDHDDSGGDEGLSDEQLRAAVLAMSPRSLRQMVAAMQRERVNGDKLPRRFIAAGKNRRGEGGRDYCKPQYLKTRPGMPLQS